MVLAELAALVAADFLGVELSPDTRSALGGVGLIAGSVLFGVSVPARRR